MWWGADYGDGMALPRRGRESVGQRRRLSAERPFLLTGLVVFTIGVVTLSAGWGHAARQLCGHRPVVRLCRLVRLDPLATGERIPQDDRRPGRDPRNGSLVVTTPVVLMLVPLC